MPFGMCPSQNRIGSPIIRCSTSFARRCAAIDNPYGPAPIMTTAELLGIRPPCFYHKSCHRPATPFHCYPNSLLPKMIGSQTITCHLPGHGCRPDPQACRQGYQSDGTDKAKSVRISVNSQHACSRCAYSSTSISKSMIDHLCLV